MKVMYSKVVKIDRENAHDTFCQVSLAFLGSSPWLFEKLVKNKTQIIFSLI